MKRMLAVSCVAAVGLSCFAQWTSVNVNISTPPRYELHEGIGVAIRNVEESGFALTVANVMKELERMRDAHDVRLPYGYTVVSTTGKGQRGVLKGNNKKKKAEVEQIVANVLKKAKGIGDAEIQPAQYKTKQEFINAFVADRMNRVDDETKEKYGKKLGGMNEYQRECRREAEKIWARENSNAKGL